MTSSRHYNDYKFPVAPRWPSSSTRRVAKPTGLVDGRLWHEGPDAHARGLCACEQALYHDRVRAGPRAPPYNQSFYDLWNANVSITPLPQPLDLRVKNITIRQLLDHKSGFDNDFIGYHRIPPSMG